MPRAFAHLLLAAAACGVASAAFGGTCALNVVSEVALGSGLGGKAEIDSDGDFKFGTATTGIGDIDADGNLDALVGGFKDGTQDMGAVWVLFLNSDGSVRNETKLASGLNGKETLSSGEMFGCSAAGIGDLDGDGVPDALVGSYQQSVFVLFMNRNGTVRSEAKITSSAVAFGRSVALLGDVDNDGVADALVGAPDDIVGKAYVVLLKADGTAKRQVFVGISPGDFAYFGTSVAGLGDVDGDGVPDALIGAPGDDTGGFDRGAVYVAFLDRTVSLKGRMKIGSGLNMGTELVDGAYFGSSAAGLGDMDGDGTPDVAVGAYGRSFDGTDEGVIFLLFLDSTGAVRREVQIASGVNGKTPVVGFDRFALAVGSLGNLNNGLSTLLVGIGSDDLYEGTAGNKASFIGKLASFLSVPQQDITIVSVEAGSIVVKTEIFQRAGAPNIRNALTNTATETLSAQLGVDVLRIDALFAPPPPSSSSSSSEKTTPADEPSAGTPNTTAIAAGSAGSAVALLACAIFALYRRRKKLRALEDAQTIDSALAFSDSFAFPLHLCSAADFARMGRLVIFEDVRAAMQHRVVDLVEDARHIFTESPARLIFLSHQWLAFDGPDPHGVQYSVMAAGVEAVIKANGWDPNDTWVWVDYSSIPQRHKPSQLAAINSLALYSSFANALVISAPNAQHVSTGQFASAVSYQNRAWCRAEQVCYAVKHGAENMYLATSEQHIVPVNQAWLMTSLLVFEGEMTCCLQKHVLNGAEQACDRLALLSPILGLYGHLYAERLGKGSKLTRTKEAGNSGEGVEDVSASSAAFSLEALMDYIEVPENKARMFPATFQLATEKRGLKKTRLFGNIVAKMELVQRARAGMDGAKGAGRAQSRAAATGSNHGAAAAGASALAAARPVADASALALARATKAALDAGQEHFEQCKVRVLQAIKAEAEYKAAVAEANAGLTELRTRYASAVVALGGNDPFMGAGGGRALTSQPSVGRGVGARIRAKYGSSSRSLLGVAQRSASSATDGNGGKDHLAAAHSAQLLMV